MLSLDKSSISNNVQLVAIFILTKTCLRCLQESETNQMLVSTAYE